MIHELGHYFCAKAMGYQALMAIDMTNEEFQTAVEAEAEPESGAARINYLEKQLLFMLGGYALEKLCGGEMHPGLMDDYMSAYGLLAELHVLTEGKELEDPIAHLEEQVKIFVEKSTALLEGFGGREEFEEQVDYFIRYMEESPVYEHVFIQESDLSFAEEIVTFKPPEAGEMHIFESMLEDS